MQKIFVTVGTSVPFDRLIVAVENWAKGQPSQEIFAQVGDSNYCPTQFPYTKFTSLDEFEGRVASCDAIVAHAGMGTILSALEAAKPILIMPRRASLNETRNDHQIATAERFAAMGKVLVAMDEQELPSKIDELLSHNVSQPPIRPHASPELIETIRKFLFDNE